VTEWTRFVDALAEELAALPSGAKVVLAVGASTFGRGYAQFHQQDDSLLAQLSGDVNLDVAARPNEVGRQAIIDAGWQPPDSAHPDNWWFELPWPLTSAVYGILADMVVQGLHQGLGVDSPDSLCYRAWNEKAGNRNLDLTSLGLPREQLR
jgi:hypothetical protein